MLISQKKARRQLRAATGLSIATCAKIVRDMPKRRDGKRLKVLASRIEAYARSVAETEAVMAAKVRVSPALRGRIARSGVVCKFPEGGTL